MELTKLRQEIDRLLPDDPGGAARGLQELWRQEAGPAAAGFVLACFEKLRGRLRLTPFRVAVARSFTVEPAIPLLRAAGYTAGMDLSVHLGDFNAYAQEILDAGSSLYRFQPDAVILAAQTSETAPDLWREHANLGASGCVAAVERVIRQFREWVSAFRGNSAAHLVLHGLENPLSASRGILDDQVEGGQTAAIQEVNRQLRCLARDFRGVYFLDYDALVARYGRANWRDERKWLTVRMPVAAHQLIHLAEAWMRFLHPLTGKLAKAVAVDLDNTLWGGVIGEDSMAGIRVGMEYPGAAYRAVQQALLDLYRRGILLAVCSKNNAEEALEALSRHPGMLLRPEHFAAMRINWNDKAQNLLELAAELNIGIDAMAFLDDNPVERQHVRRELPEVIVLEPPSDPMGYAQAVRDSPVFERLSLSEEDRQRGAYYAAERQRLELRQSAGTREDFYRSLRQEAEIAPVTPMTLARIAQLTQKTNQFNLTTRRYSEAQLAAMTPPDGWHVRSIRVSDCYSDNGLVGVAITRDQGEAREIDTFLLSCRVIGRTVETALLSRLVDEARAAGMRRIQGWFLPTKKNMPAAEFYRQHGFQPILQEQAGTLWALDLEQGEVRCPEWIRLMVREEGES
jgi:FkbH-like protein